MDSSTYTQLAWREPAPADFKTQVQHDLALTEAQVAALRRLAQYGLTEPQLHHLGRAFIKTRDNGQISPDLTPFRLAILSNATTEHMQTALIATGLRYGLNLHVLGFNYDEAYAVAVGGDARLLQFKPDAVLIAIDYRGLRFNESYGNVDDERKTIDDCAAYLRAMYEGVRKIGATCIGQTIPYPPSSTFGHADRKILGTLRRIIESLNAYIAQTADCVLDIAALSEIIGSAQWFDAKLSHVGKIPFSLSCVSLYADHVGRLLGALRGKSRKVLVLDLDNTLWGGVIGDDGVEGIQIGNGSPTGEAFLSLQRKAASLRKRGILLAVSSKNNEEQALKPFREIPDMVLKEDSFSAFRANWNDKAANIEAIAKELSLGLDSFVFVDDNPTERALVRKFLPEVEVPELPADPAYYAATIDAAGYFESLSFSEEDARRADLYRNRGAIARLDPKDLEGYLASLDMKLTIDKVSAINRARVVQLINKSNQFNLTTLRLTDNDIQDMEARADHFCYALRLTDKFDDHGIISIILCRKDGDVFDIFLWVMSCRVIGRGIEKAITGFLTDKAQKAGCTTLRGTYIPTSRNQMVENHYAGLGFSQGEKTTDGQVWLRSTTSPAETASSMQIIDNS